LSGGGGNDIFEFNLLADSSINSSDLIVDFSKGQDDIDISGLGFTGITNNTAQTNNAILTYEFSNNQTVITNEEQSFCVKLSGMINLDVWDFIF
jgi:hypothetical protein